MKVCENNVDMYIFDSYGISNFPSATAATIYMYICSTGDLG